MGADELDPPKRPDLFVVARFLGRLAEPGAEHTRSSLQRAAGVNYDVFRRYLKLLEDRELVRVEAVDEGSDRIRLTRAGRDARQELVAWLQDVFGAALR